MGGTWISQNKVRSSAYFNFVGVATPSMQLGERGIGTMAIPLDWGAEGELINVYSMDMLSGDSLPKIGMTAFDKEARLLSLMLSNCYMAKVYRLNKGGVRATATEGNLTIQAKYSGVKGNSITVTVIESDGVFTVTTYFSGTEVDAQQAITVQELANNNFVEFSGQGALAVSAGIVLAGGTNGAVNISVAYPDYLSLASKTNWQVMALTQDNAEFASKFAEYAERMRNDEGKYVQVVVANYDAADGYSVINSDCGVMVGDEMITAEEATAWVAGITAGAAINQSNGSKVFPGATKLLHERTNSEIIEAIKNGKFILSVNSAGEIVVEKDINSLHTFSDKLTKDFRLNQVVRVIDEIGTTASLIWERQFKDKVSNNSRGRAAFRATLINYFNELQRIEAIENFGGAGDITIAEGNDKEAVLLTIERLDIVVAMSTLYGIVYMI